MSNEWRDLPTMADVAVAQAAGDEIEVDTGPYWEAWRGDIWKAWYDFRARPRQPATKKIKMLCYYMPISKALAWYNEIKPVPKEWKRVPSEDKEIEVQDD